MSRIQPVATIRDDAQAGTAARAIRSLIQSVEAELAKAETAELDAETRLEAARKTMDLLDAAAVDAARLLKALGFGADGDRR